MMIGLPFYPTAQVDVESTFQKELEASVQKMNGLSGDFTQVKMLSFIDNEIVSSGTFNYEGEDYLKWEYLKPYQYVMEINNGKLITFDGKNKVEMDVNSSQTFKTINNIFLKSIKGDILDTEDIFESKIEKASDQYLVTLSPKDEGLRKYIKEMKLTFSQTTMLVTEVIIFEQSGDQMEIAFSNQIINE